MNFVIGAFVTFFLSFIFVPLGFWFLRFICFYVVVPERTSMVYMFLGKVVGVIDEPGIHFLWGKIGFKTAFIWILGKRYVLDMRLDQTYLRSRPVNSEEGAPMGIGIWYEMYISNPADYLFKNTDPRGSLRANVTNTTVRCLSNLKLDDMLTNRHAMSREVRAEVSPLSEEWGYQLGSVYVRKVHFRDRQMIRQIEEKVVNRLRQVTSAILQAGENQVSVITSTANRKAAVEFARAEALRPRIVGEALERISTDPEVTEALFDILEIQNILKGEGKKVTLIPKGKLIGDLLAAQED